MPDWPNPSISVDPNKNIFPNSETSVAPVNQSPQSSQVSQNPNLTGIQEQSAFKDDISHVIEGRGKPPKKTKKTAIKLALFLIVIIVTAGLAGGFYILNNFKNNPLRLISESFAKAESANSYSAKATLTQTQSVGNVEFLVDYHKAPLLFSRGQLKINSIGGEIGNNILILAIFNSTDQFIQASYSKIDELENQIGLYYPDATNLQTYKLILPVIKGQKWLHISTPDDNSRPNQNHVEISQDKQDELDKKFLDSIVVRDHETNYKIGETKYHKIILGFDKDKLVSFIEALRSLDLNVQLSEINSLIRIVQSVDSWNDNLVEILIEKETGSLYSLSLSIPKIPEDALQQSLEESVSNQGTFSTFSNLFSDKLNDVIAPKGTSDLVYIGKVELTNYNLAPSAQRPAPILEQTQLQQAFQYDLPYILQAALVENPGLNTPFYTPGLLNEKNFDVLSASISGLLKEEEK